MVDERIKKWAKTLINYSLEVEEGNFVLIESSPLAMPLIKECYREVLKAGAHAQVILKPEGIDEILYNEGSEEQIKYISPLQEKAINIADRRLAIIAYNNTKSLAGINPEKIALRQKASGKLFETYMERVGKGELKWSLCVFPTESSAQEGNMSLTEYEEFIYEACLLNDENPTESWKKVHKDQQKIIDYLKDKSEIHVISNDTDLTVNTKDRIWINSDGHTNFPSGEVFTAPIEDSINGHIRFSFPGIYAGQEIEDIRLTFKNGKVVKAEAARGQDLLLALLETDKGAKYVGEFAIGTNYGITKFTKNMLFDEKIGGTIHLALGRAYPKSGGKNVSAIHWDMLCDMKNGGEIYADGELFYKDGIFIK